MDIELRGYEVCRLVGSRAEKVGTYRPTNLGLETAIRTAARLNDTHHAEVYTVRALVSIPPPRPAEEATPTLFDGTPDQLPLPGVA